MNGVNLMNIQNKKQQQQFKMKIEFSLLEMFMFINGSLSLFFFELKGVIIEIICIYIEREIKKQMNKAEFYLFDQFRLFAIQLVASI